MLDGAIYNAPDLGTETQAENGKTPDKLSEEDQLRRELQVAAKLCPDLTPTRINQLVEEFRRKKEAEANERQ